MELPNVRARAVIFDVYGTLLEVAPPPPDAPERWARLWRQRFDGTPRLDLAGFSNACASIIAREHAQARERGITFPEVYWPAVVVEALPELSPCSSAELEDFLFHQAQLWHTVTLADGARRALQTLREGGLLLGIASNAQAYTLRELGEALVSRGLGMDLFASDLCFWSFQHGFSKPDPHVFQILSARLAARGISRSEILMVGDRLDNDIAPAMAQGWQTWQMSPEPMKNGKVSGDWDEFIACFQNPE